MRARPTFNFPPLSELQACADPRRPLSGALAEPPSLTGYEPNHTNKDQKLFTEDKQLAEHQGLAEHEDLRVKPLLFHRPSIASTYDSRPDLQNPEESKFDCRKNWQ